MSGRKMRSLGVTFVLLLPVVAPAQHGSGGHSHSGGGGHHGGWHRNQTGGWPLAAVGGGYAAYGFGWPYFVAGPAYYPMMLPMGPAGFFPPFGAMPPPAAVRGPLLPPPPPREPIAEGKAARPVASDPGRAAHYLTFGDRLFRAGNIKKAEERYLQARNAAPDRAAPQLRLALIALARGHYTEAANRLRDAETAEPGWVLTAPDVQAIYGEPAEFLRQLARVESHIQSHPDDRDAWLVLGAQWFLSGRTARAADVFLRLDDPNRKPDIALAAFLVASNRAKAKTDDASQATR
jgi:hypothetical protein